MRVIKWIYEYARDQLFINFHLKHCHYVKDNEVVSINWFNKYSNSPHIHIYDTSDTNFLLLPVTNHTVCFISVLLNVNSTFPTASVILQLTEEWWSVSYLYKSGSFPKFKSVKCRERSLSSKFFLKILESGKRTKFSVIAINNFKATYFPTQ